MRVRYTGGILVAMILCLALSLQAAAASVATDVIPALSWTVTPATPASIKKLKRKAKKLCTRRCIITDHQNGFEITLEPKAANPLTLPFAAVKNDQPFAHSAVTFWSGGKTHIAAHKLLSSLNTRCKAVELKLLDNTGYTCKKDTKKVAAVFAKARKTVDARKAQAFAQGEIITLGGRILGDAPQKPLNALLRARKAYNSGDIPTALKDVATALKLKPDFAEALALRGRMHTQEVKLEEARKDYDAAISIKPTFVQALIWRANLSLEQGRINDALKDTTDALAINPGANQALYLRSLCHAANSDWQQAYDDMSAALRGPKDYDPLALYLLGSASIQMKKIKQAESWLAVLKERFPDFAKINELSRRIEEAKSGNKEILPGFPLRKKK